MGPVELPDPLEVTASTTRVLESLGGRHLIGGSLASSVHGEPRSTNDVDLLVDFPAEDVEPFVEAVRGDHYVSEPAIRTAVTSGYHFNLIHTNAAVKVDPFLAGDDAFNLERLTSGILYSSRLDRSRLSRWAPQLGVADLGDRAFQEPAGTE